MIHAEKGRILIDGSCNAICCEVENILRTFRKSTEEKLGKEESEKLFNKIVENSMKSDGHVIEEFKKQASDILQDILKTITEGIGD